MARKTALQRRLEEYGFNLAMFRRAVQFFADRKFSFGYGGRGRFRGTFHISGMFGGGQWKSFRCYDPSMIMDRPTQVIQDLQTL